MTLITKYYNPKAPDFQVHKFITKNGQTRYYDTEDFSISPKKYPRKKEHMEHLIEIGRLCTREELSKDMLKNLEIGERIMKERREDLI